MKKLIGMFLTMAVVAALSFGPIGCGKDNKTKSPAATVVPTIAPTGGGGVTVVPTVVPTKPPT